MEWFLYMNASLTLLAELHFQQEYNVVPLFSKKEFQLYLTEVSREIDQIIAPGQLYLSLILSTMR